MRKLASLLLALVLVFSLATTAFAASGTNDNTGKITITNAVKDQTYTIYQILKLESYDTEKNAYSYKAASDTWATWLATQKTYVNIDDDGYVTWVEKADAAAFAKAAKEYATKNSIGNQGSKKAESTKVEFTELNLGYYLVDTTLGTLCSLDTTDNTVDITEKNGVPTNVKTVEEDSTGTYGSTNDADIGQIVNFKSTITAQVGAENYVFHDVMSAGLTYQQITGITLNDVEVASSNYTVKVKGAETNPTTDNCTFEVVFTQAFCDTLKANDKIVISYQAKVNENAVIGGNGNPNTSKLSYGDSSNATTNVTPPSTTITYTWDMKVLKYGNGVESNTLAGAKFVLIKKETSNDTTKELVATFDGDKFKAWTEVTKGEDDVITWPENAELTTDNSGAIHVVGLDADNYFLREIEPPKGFNIKKDDTPFTIKPTTGEDNTLTYTTVETKINNQSGTELPSTGGMGTTIFYILGSVLVLAAGVLLVTKKRMSAEN